MHHHHLHHHRGGGSPRSRRIRAADAVGRSRGGGGAGGGSGTGGGSGGVYSGGGGPFSGGGGFGGQQVGLEIQSELVAALAKCEAALKAKTREVQQLRTQLTNGRCELDDARKRWEAELAALQRDVDDTKERSRQAIQQSRQERDNAVEAAERGAASAVAAAQAARDEAVATAQQRARDEVAAARSEKAQAVAAAEKTGTDNAAALRHKYQKTLDAIREQAANDSRQMQDAVASLTRQLAAAEKSKADAEEHAASLTAKVKEAEHAEEKLRAAQRSTAALEHQISEFQDIVLRQRAVIGDLNREAQVAQAAHSLVTESLHAAQGSAVGTDSPRASVALPVGQKLTGMDLRLQQELIMKYEELLRFKEAEAANKTRELQAEHAAELEAVGEAHTQQMAHLRDVCQAQILGFSMKHQALQDHLQHANSASTRAPSSASRRSGRRSPPPPAMALQHHERSWLRAGLLQQQQERRRRQHGASISLDGMGESTNARRGSAGAGAGAGAGGAASVVGGTDAPGLDASIPLSAPRVRAT